MNKPLSFNVDALQPLMTSEFVLGVGTSAYQIEGAVGAGGRADSVWDSFCRVPENIADQSSGDVACDHYHRWQEDVALVKALGVDVYRFSISWSRVVPDETGTVNEEGLAFYKRLVIELREQGIRPMVTLHHWDLPQYLQDKGGWQNRITAFRFAEYATVVAEGLGSTVDLYTTINEPWCIVALGHGSGVHAPGLSDPAAAAAATHHLLLAHGLAMQTLRDRAPRAELGIVLNGGPSFPLSESECDVAAASQFESEQLHRFASPVFAGKYPDEFSSQVAEFVESEDLQIISEPCDYLGWNYYTRNVVKSGEGSVAHVVAGRDFPRTEMDWEIYPDGLRKVCMILREHYELPPLYISENGAAFKDESVAGEIRDQDRIDYIQNHLQVIAGMIESGVDIRGYICWTLLDNFEWAEGYCKRFGLVHVNFDTQERTMKASGKAYAELCSAKADLVNASKGMRIDVARQN